MSAETILLVDRYSQPFIGVSKAFEQFHASTWLSLVIAKLRFASCVLTINMITRLGKTATVLVVLLNLQLYFVTPTLQGPTQGAKRSIANALEDFHLTNFVSLLRKSQLLDLFQGIVGITNTFCLKLVTKSRNDREINSQYLHQQTKRCLMNAGSCWKQISLV